ncbi:MAG: cysteine desulfurase-like protein [Calditrichaeota bacterium]|nr:MAG: cysteine desulfurase-like protein [Calditrichota bacterium]MBL1205686.1 cysteine desulfurase-like protein [Calditrichota bacterium]NOG45514.1 cysteine desulfurase-like protein [Calditrichota bacterium]
MKIKSIEQIRSNFPALKRTHNSFPIAYFDGPGGTQVPTRVAEAVTDYLFNHNGNSAWAYPTSEETTDLVKSARQTFAAFFNSDPNEVVFGANMTTLTYHLSRALGGNLKVGDEIIVTDLDHHANVDPWKQLETEVGAVIKSVKFNLANGKLDIADFKNKLSSKTKIVAMGAASNALGTINDIKKISQLSHDVGALVFVDAVHYAAHHLIDVQEFKCDFLACSPYKFYGPHAGVLFGRHELLQKTNFPKLVPAYDAAPYNAETGTPNFEGIMGAAAAVNFLASLAEGNSTREKLVNAFTELEIRGNLLLAKLWNGLSAINGVKLYGPSPGSPRTSTIAFTVNNYSSEEITKKLVENGIFTSHGDFYATTVVERLGLSEAGLVRAGCACYTTEEEVERLIRSVASL